MTTANTLALLREVNTLITEVNPIVGAAVSLGAMLVAQIKSSGQNVGDFATEVAKFDAAVGAGLSADAKWRADHSLTPPAAPVEAPPTQT